MAKMLVMTAEVLVITVEIHSNDGEANLRINKVLTKLSRRSLLSSAVFVTKTRLK
jgi:hypothetical protein